jgi:glycosyltransferase involved in cell wall biosynthesis
MKKISVVVPVYNVENYLQRCIDSIIAQSYKNLEIIIVNDGSTDKSGEICDNYKKQDIRIKVIHKENGGLSSARNVGIEASTGEYIAFVDSDDWIVGDIYEHCINIFETEQCDVVDFKVVFDDGGINQYNSSDSYNTRIIDEREVLHDYLFRGQTEKAPFSACRKLYKLRLFDTVRFPDGKINEDIATNYRVLTNCKKMVISNKIGYHYFQNSVSTTRNGLMKRDFDLLYACEELQVLTQNAKDDDIKYLVQVKYARSYFSLLAKIAFYGFGDNTINKKTVIKNLTKKLRENYFLLMKSPIPLNRKLMVTALCINIRCLSTPLTIYKRIK